MCIVFVPLCLGSRSTLRRSIWKRSLISPVCLSTHTYPSRTWIVIFENALQGRGGLWKCQLSVLVWIENILKTQLPKNDGPAIIMWFPYLSFRQTQNQNGQRLLCFQISLVQCERALKVAIFLFTSRTFHAWQFEVCEQQAAANGWKTSRIQVPRICGVFITDMLY